MKAILFILYFIFIYLGAHIFIWASFYYFLNIKENYKNYYHLLFVFLTASFIFSMIITRLSHNVFTKYYYIFSAAWIGLLINLVIIFSLFWFIAVALKLLNINFNHNVFGIIALFLGLIITTYGIINAFNPGIKNIDVEIKNLGEDWKGKKIVQISDVHLGNIHGANFLKNIINKINNINPEIVFITGDLFDGADGDINHYAEIFNTINAKNGVYFITGNHESYLEYENPLDVIKKTKIQIIDNEKIIINGLRVVGLGFPSSSAKIEYEKIMPEEEKDMPTILLFHTPSAINRDQESYADGQVSAYWKPNTDMTAAKNAGVNLQLSGHTHNGQTFPFNFLTRLIYNGYNYGLKNDGDFNIYTSSGVGTWGPPMRVGIKPEIVLINLK